MITVPVGAVAPGALPGIFSMIWILLAAFAASALATLAVIASAHRHAHWSADHDLSGPQKMHVQAVPRVGGVGIFAGVLGGSGMAIWLHPDYRNQIVMFLVCMLPAFLSGLWEDFTKAISPRRRMVALALSGLLGVLLLDGVIVRSGWLPLDHLLLVHGLAWIGTVGAILAVTGVSNSVNIIDGMNGLASMCVALMACALAWISWRVQDAFVGGFALATLGATLGFFVWNYPRGLVFLGDGGAYLLGCIVAELGILLSARHPEVSMLAPLLIVVYPFFETLFSMYRRRVLQRSSMTQPDGIHLHTLIYRRLKRGAVDKRGVSSPRRANSGTSPYLWLLALVGIAPAAIWWNNSPVLALALLLFVLAYLSLYWRIVRFRSPRWMKARRRGAARGHGPHAP
jgi:UDP-N-acetylmuramyl pentapeptide phosphotransferase/UDP-N-acetylglucosamine-1-phosphate transferase